MKQTELERDVDALIRPVAENMGVDIVWVGFQGGILSVLAEDPKTGHLGLDDCAALSRAISPVLEAADPIPAAYRLEVGSPGVERPLVRPKDYESYAGFDAKIELDMPLNGQKRFKGTLAGFKGDDTILLKTDAGEKELPFHGVRQAHLVITDALLKAGKEKVKHTA
jgi:ribosome maturation factor RimP